MTRQIRTATFAAAVCGFVSVSAEVRAQQAATGTVSGRVTDRESQQPLAATQVFLVGGTRGAVTDENGVYRIVSVPAGPAQVRTRRVGYTSLTQPVTITAGGTATADFALGRTATQLDEVVVTATGETVQKRQQGTAVATITTDTLQLAPIQNFSQVLQGRAPGVTISQSGGATGSGATVRIRGANSLSLSNEPLLVIDGVRVNSSNTGDLASTLDVGGQEPSRLNDLNPEEIESVEILKGPAASALYGTAAANGVIQVTTKRGRTGKPQWNSWLEAGALDDVYDIPDNYAVITAGGDTVSGILPDVATGDEEFSALQQFNPLRNSDVFRTGQRRQLGTSVSGGSAAATYFVSGEYEKEDGIFISNGLERVSLRTNLAATPRNDLNLGVQAGYLTSDLRQPQNDNNGNGILPQGLLGSAVNDANGGFFAFAPEITRQLESNQGIRRFTGSGNVDYRPLSWLALVGTAGVDVLNRDEREILPPDVFTDSPDNIAGYRQRNRLAVNNYTATANATATFDLTPKLTSTTSAGSQLLRQSFEGTQALGYGVLGGTASLDGTTRSFEVGEFNQDERTIGFFGRQQFGYDNRLFLTASVRSDANSNFGENVGFVTYPQFEGSWVVNEESFFPQTNAFNSLRLRAAWGQSGLQPTYRTAERFYEPAAVRVNARDVVGFTFGGTGNPDLDPEVITEVEGGLDAGFLNGRLGFLFTYYRRNAQDAIVARRIAPSVGVSQDRLENIGELTNQGTEWQVNAQLVQGPRFAWDATVNFTTRRERVDRLREGVDPIIFGLGGNSQRHQPGYAVGGYWALPYTYDDADGNGLLSAEELTLGEEQVFIGTPTPKRELGVSSSVTLFRNVRLSGLVDYRGGHKLYNATGEFRCLFGICQGLNDPNSSLEEQARSLAAANGTIYGFVEDASFVRLRELSLTLGLPARLATSLRASGASVTLAGRNLGLWSDYSGADPEINSSGQLNFSRNDFLGQPPVRTYTARFQLTF
jgi:TonB-linked SusC/RagA family outer membrane protein